MFIKKGGSVFESRYKVIDSEKKSSSSNLQSKEFYSTMTVATQENATVHTQNDLSDTEESKP